MVLLSLLLQLGILLQHLVCLFIYLDQRLLGGRVSPAWLLLARNNAFIMRRPDGLFMVRFALNGRFLCDLVVLTDRIVVVGAGDRAKAHTRLLFTSTWRQE